ncbi:MAG TPA: MFS transporter [Rhodothermales bacterium]|nr:MFS transporter [Rhodothermales bacterium]
MPNALPDGRPAPVPPRLPRAVWVLGLVSFCVDLSSELLYPVLPLFLVSLGTPLAAIGLAEGIAEVTGGLAKGYFGGLSDRLGKRRAFVTAGYTLSALAKPLPGLIPAWGTVLLARVTDRVGKGLRTAPRDALLSAYTTAEMRGRAFGLHRAMDTAGAALGPLFALVWLAARPGDYRPLFFIALVPALVGALLTRLVPERAPEAQRAASPANPFAYWRMAPAAYRRRVAWLVFFALGNASDVFLLLRIREGVGDGGPIPGDTAALGAYVLYNGVYALGAYPAGALADRLGRWPVLVVGFVLFAVVYAGFAVAGSLTAFAVLMAVYGLYAALTEGVAKAWIADVLPDTERGRGLGLHAAATSLAVLLASVGTGALWGAFGAMVPFGLSAAVALVAAAGIARVERRGA